jgi:hypothetical protein
MRFVETATDRWGGKRIDPVYETDWEAAHIALLFPGGSISGLALVGSCQDCAEAIYDILMECYATQAGEDR